MLLLLDEYPQGDDDSPDEANNEANLGLGVSTGSPAEVSLSKLKFQATQFLQQRGYSSPSRTKLLERYRELNDDVLQAFLEHVGYSDGDTDDDAQEDKDFLTLTTVHQAKGLEWPLVCIVRTNEGFVHISV